MASKYPYGRPMSPLNPNRRTITQTPPLPTSQPRPHSPPLVSRNISNTTFQPFSMSLKRALSLGSKKDLPAPAAEDLKAKISGPHSLKYGAEQFRARNEAQEARRGHNRSRSQLTLVGSIDSATSPLAAMSRRGSRGSQSPKKLSKTPMRVRFAAADKPLPPTPTSPTIPVTRTPKASDIFNSTPTGTATHVIPVTVRKSVALSEASTKRIPSTIYSFFPDLKEDDPAARAVMDTRPSDGLIRVPGRDGTVVIFRNEEERALAIRVLATMRESRMDPNHIDDGRPKCGRDCIDCARKANHSRSSSDTTSATAVDIPTHTRSGSRSSSPSDARVSYPTIVTDEITFVVTEEDDPTDERAPRMSMADFDQLAPEVDWYEKLLEALHFDD